MNLLSLSSVHRSIAEYSRFRYSSCVAHLITLVSVIPISFSGEPAFLRGCEIAPEVRNFGLIFDKLEVAKSSVILPNKMCEVGKGKWKQHRGYTCKRLESIIFEDSHKLDSSCSGEFHHQLLHQFAHRCSLNCLPRRAHLQ